MIAVDQNDHLTRPIVIDMLGEVVLDCAAEVSVCPWNFGEKLELLTKDNLELKAADGRMIQYHGRRIIALRQGQSQIEVEFHVADVTKTILSVSKLVQHGVEVLFEQNNAVVKFLGAEVHLQRRGGLF